MRAHLASCFHIIIFLTPCLKNFQTSFPEILQNIAYCPKLMISFVLLALCQDSLQYCITLARAKQGEH